ncbi:MAG: GntR family transcriptional regulator [Acidimicrobiales bacterium]
MESEAPLINFRLDPRTGVAPYRQLVDQVRQAVSLGLLRAGDRLPSVREVVTQITINPNTVHRAYRDLEHEGVVEGRPGLGTFVVASSSQLASEDREKLISGLRDWVDRARLVGLDAEGIAALVAAVMASEEPIVRE